MKELTLDRRLTRKEVLGLGVTDYALRMAERRGLVRRLVLPGMKYGRFLAGDVVRVFGGRGDKGG